MLIFRIPHIPRAWNTPIVGEPHRASSTPHAIHLTNSQSVSRRLIACFQISSPNMHYRAQILRNNILYMTKLANSTAGLRAPRCPAPCRRKVNQHYANRLQHVKVVCNFCTRLYRLWPPPYGHIIFRAKCVNYCFIHNSSHSNNFKGVVTRVVEYTLCVQLSNGSRVITVRVKIILHGIKGFVIPTKSFVKIGITKNILLQQQNV